MSEAATSRIERSAHTNLMEAPELSVKVVTEFLQRVSTHSGVGAR